MLDYERLRDRNWQFFIRNGGIATHEFRFNSDGSVGGYDNDNERHWKIDDGILALMNREQQVTVRFDSIAEVTGTLLLQGQHLADPSLILCLREVTSAVNEVAVPPQRISGTKAAFRHLCEKFGWSIGDHTYGTPIIFEDSLAQLTIGKYCSISGDVKIALGNHRTDTLTTYPFVALRQHWDHVPSGARDHSSKGDVVIGSDVWIGYGTFIASGVRIGSGAIVAAQSSVTKDVPPYAIVAGNPARIVRYRFAQDVIDQLLTLAWWDLDDSAVDTLIPLLLSDRVDDLLAEVRRLRAQPG